MSTRPATLHLLLFSASTRAALLGDVEQFDARALAQAERNLAARAPQAHRLAVVAGTADEFATRRTSIAVALARTDALAPIGIAGTAFYGYVNPQAPREPTACLFPGFGVRHRRLLDDLLRIFPWLRTRLAANGWPSEQLDDVLESGAISPVAAGLLSDLAMWTLLRAAGLRCDAVAGHSFGENAALVAVGLIPDGVSLATRLEEIIAMSNARPLDAWAEPLGMIAISAASRPVLDPLLTSHPPRAFVALDNCPSQIVVWGPAASLAELERAVQARRETVFRITDLDQPVHTPLFPVSIDEIRARYATVALAVPRVPVWSAATVDRLPDNPAAVREQLARQWIVPVRFHELAQRLFAEGVRLFVEIGPGDRLSGFVRDTLRGTGVGTVPTNVQGRGTLAQILVAAAQLFTRGHDLDMAPLLERFGDERPATGSGVRRPQPAERRVLEAETAPERLRELESMVASEVAELIEGMRAGDLDRDLGFFEIGLDSVGCIALVDRLERTFGTSLPQTLPFDQPSIRRLAQAIGDLVAPADAVVSGLSRTSAEFGPGPAEAGPHQDDIAVVGIGCRFPGGADSPAAFWTRLVEGHDAVNRVPADRWDVSMLDPDAVDDVRERASFGAFLENVRDFDAAFFGISPREATALDPQQRLLLEVTWEALEHAAINPRSLAGSRTGVFVGISNTDYASRLSVRERLAAGGYVATGNTASTAAGRLSFVLGLTGPCLALDTACSSSLAAVHLAAQSLRRGESDVALAGGVNLLINPETTVFLSHALALSPTGRCRTFDAAADGYVRGEGCGILVLKRLREAQAAGDRVLGVVRGSAMNHDGRTSGLTVPNGPSQEAVVRHALSDARCEPGEVTYVEAHGTGTSLGDPIEVNALARVFGALPRRSVLQLGSVKTNIGHLEAAAGVASLVKVLLQMQHRRLAPSLHYRAPNPRVSWTALKGEVVTSARDWPSQPAVAGVSSFGISGTNVHVVVAEAPAADDTSAPAERSRAAHVLPVSAASEAAVRTICARLVTHLQAHPDIDLDAVSRTLTRGRAHFSYRRAVVVADRNEAIARLGAIADGHESVHHRRAPTPPRLAFLFTGQGAQTLGMGRDLYTREPVFRDALNECSRDLEQLIGEPLINVMFGVDAKRLEQTGWAQPALFAFEYALTRLWRLWGVIPNAVIGHSVGELAAACVAGVFTLSDGLRLIGSRARLMQALPPGGAMLAVEADSETVEPLLRGQVSVTIAAINARDRVVLSGPAADIAAVGDACARLGIATVLLSVSHAFHSPLIAPMLEDFRVAASQISLHPPRLPLMSNVTGRVADAAITSTAYWTDHIRQPVRFADGIEALLEDGAEIGLEVGPRPVLAALASRVDERGRVEWMGSLCSPEAEQAQVLAALGRLYEAGVEIDWVGFDDRRTGPRAELPTYPFERETYWIESADEASLRLALSERSESNGLASASVAGSSRASASIGGAAPPRASASIGGSARPRASESISGLAGGPSTRGAVPALPPLVASRQSLRDELRGLDAPARRARVTTFLQNAVGAILRLPPARPIDPLLPLQTAGLDSLMALQLSAVVRRRLGVSIAPATIVAGSVDALAQRVSDGGDRAAALGDATVPSLEAVLADPSTQLGVAPSLSPLDSARGDPELVEGSRGGPSEALSYGQRALWFLWMLAPDSTAYNQSLPLRIKGSPDQAQWREAARLVVERHAMLRTRFHLRDGEPVQQVHSEPQVDWSATDTRGWAEDAVADAMAAAHARLFDLAADPPIRFHWFTYSGGDGLLLVTMHHVACDGWSLEVLRRDLARLTEALADRTSAVPEPPRHTYLDFVRWQQAVLSGPSGDRLWHYWQRTLAEPRAQLDLPTDRPRPPIQSYRGEAIAVHWPRPLAEQVRQLAVAKSVTPYVLLLTAFLAVLARWTRQRDLVVGTPAAGRSQPEFMDIVGYFVDPIVIRARLAEGATFQAFLEEVSRASRDALAHGDFPFALLVERLRVPRDPSRSPIFDITFNYVNRRAAAAGLGEGPARLPEAVEIPQADGKFDLTLTVIEDDDTMRAAIGFNVDLFDRSTIAHAGDWFVRMLEAMCRDGEQIIDAVPLAGPSRGGGTSGLVLVGRITDVAALGPVHEVIAAQALRFPNELAVVAEDGRLTYAELMERAARLAKLLSARGVGADSPVGLCTGRSTDFVVGLLATLHAGGAFVPLDPAWPADLRQRMLHMAGARALLTTSVPHGDLSPRWLQGYGDRLGGRRSTPALDSLAYVMFTSGSTGAPKGVAVDHRALANYASSIVDDLEIQPRAQHAFVSTIGADLGLTVVFPALMTGGTLHVLSDDAVTDRQLFARYLSEHAIDYLKIVPSHLAALVGDHAPVLPRRAVILGGESTPTSWVARLQQRTSCRFFNHYGPTETTIGVMTCAVDRIATISTPTLPLDRAVANARVWLLDEAQQPVPRGLPGEIFVSGPCLARGYIGDPERTRERFVRLPAGDRAYRTGDLARELPDGSLHLLGRQDRQVKLRGYRVEPGQTEAVLSDTPEVRQVVVLPDRDGPAASSLIAWIVPAVWPAEAGLVDALRSVLAARLPHYMIPAQLLLVERIPLTSNGKVDVPALRQAVPAPSPRAGAERPRDLVEMMLQRIWQHVLGVSRVRPGDDFFELGGHSLAAVRMASLVYDERGQHLPLATVFTHRTLEQLASAIRSSASHADARLLVPMQTGDGSALLVCFPGAGGSILYFHPLVAALGPDVPVWGAQAVDDQVPADIPSLAGAYAEALEAQFPAGAFRLVGHSFGALVAFEVARQLRSRGRDVALLAVIDNPAPGLGDEDGDSLDERDWLLHIGTRIERLYGVDLDLSHGPAPRDAGWLLDRLLGAGVLPPGTSRGFFDRYVEIYRANVRAAAEYRPPARSLDVALTVFKAEDEDAALRRVAIEDQRLGWERFSTIAVTAIGVPGTHITILTTPNVAVLAGHLRRLRDQGATPSVG